MKFDTLGYAANMFCTGLLDEQFQKLHLLQDESEPYFVAEVVTLFCVEGELAKQLDKPCVDFDKVDAFAHKLEASGAPVHMLVLRVKNTCIQFHEFCQGKSRDGCLKTLDTLRVVFYDLCGKFMAMLQLEQQQAEATK